MSNNYKKFTKIAECIIELNKLIADETPIATTRFKDGLCQFIPDEYFRVRTTLFPFAQYSCGAPSYGYGAPSAPYWNNAWAADSPVPPVRPTSPMMDIFENRDAFASGIAEESGAVKAASDFVEAVSGCLSPGHLKDDFTVKGEVINAVRDQDYARAMIIIQNNWIEEPKSESIAETFGAPTAGPITINTSSLYHCNCGAYVGESLLGQVCPLCNTAVVDCTPKPGEEEGNVEDDDYSPELDDDITD